jgi:hypothetical protein
MNTTDHGDPQTGFGAAHRVGASDPAAQPAAQLEAGSDPRTGFDAGHQVSAADRAELARAQARLVAALVAGGELPAGFDAERVGVTRDALLAKRAGLAARAWPVLASQLGPQWMVAVRARLSGQPTGGGLRDGWDIARWLAARGELPPAAAVELRGYERRWRYDGTSTPRPRRATALRHGLARLLDRVRW